MTSTECEISHYEISLTAHLLEPPISPYVFLSETEHFTVEGC